MKICSSRDLQPRFSETRHPVYPVVDSSTGPRRNQRIRGWIIYERPDGCLTAPDPTRVSACGMISIVLLGLFFWPLMCLPCFCSASYDGYQIPVYETVIFPTAPVQPSAPPLVIATAIPDEAIKTTMV